MTNRSALVCTFLVVAAGIPFARDAKAATLQPVSNWGASGVPNYISMYIYVPDKPATNPPILVLSHYCGGSASAVFGQAQNGGIVAAADKYGFIIVVPQTTNAASSAKCWDVGSKASLTHDGGGDTQAVAQMVKYAITTYKANADRIYATGDSSGGMMTQALLAVYPDVFKAGASFAGVAAGCWSAGWSAASNWGGTCAGGNDIQTAAQWGDLVRGMYPSYTGHRPRVQLFHGDADSIINYKNFGESIKEWTNVLGLNTTPTSTTTGLTLGTHQATRQQWKNSCGYVVLDAYTSLGGDHGPSDALFPSNYVVPFLGLDKTGSVDPEVTACSADAGVGGAVGDAGTGGGAGTGGTSDAGGDLKDGGGTTGSDARSDSAVASGGTSGSGGSVGSGGSGGSGGSTGSGGTSASGGRSGSGGANASGGATASGGNFASGGNGNGSGGASSPGTGGNASTGGAGAGATPGSGSTGCACAFGDDRGGKASRSTALFIFGLALCTLVRRRRGG